MQARDLARELAPARDVQAALDALADLRHCEAALPSRSVSAMSARIESRRQAEDGAASADIRERIASYLARAEAALSAFPTESMDVRDLAAALARAYARARKLIPRDWDAASAEELHELRQRVVIHRYQVEIVQPLWPRYIRVTAGEAQRLRERLGHYQDLVVLEALTGPRGELARWRSRLGPLISERKQAHAAAAAHHAGRLFAERPRSLQRKLEGLWSNPS
jgi:CHAD domain-containing protein